MPGTEATNIGELTEMKLKCRKCQTFFESHFNPRAEGSHKDHECNNCGQLLQWDWPGGDMTPQGAVRVGPPQPCCHGESRIDGALVPLTCSSD